MTEQSISLKVSGPLLSKLFHESYCNEGYCGGMLLGEIISITKNEITDSDHRTTEHSTICVQDFQPMRQKQSFFLNDHSEESFFSNCVGFYRIRTSANCLSLLEKSMHKSLGRDNRSHNRKNVVTLLITYDKHMDISCLSWKIRAYVQKFDGEFSVVKVHVTNLQGSVLNSYVTNPNPTSDVLSSEACATLQAFQSTISEEAGKIKLVDSTREVTNNLIAELEQTVDEYDRHQSTLEKCYKEKLILSKQLQLLTAKLNEIEYQKSYPKPTQLHSSKMQNKRHDVKAPDDHSFLSHHGEDYGKMQKQSVEDVKLKSPVVVLKKIDLTSELMASSQALRLPVQGEQANTSGEARQNRDNVTEDLICFDDVA